MNRNQLQKILLELKEDRLSIEDTIAQLKHLPFEDLEFAKIDHHRSLRRGFPEVIYCEGKTPEQVIRIIEKLKGASNVLATRVSPELAREVQTAFPSIAYNEIAKTLTLVRESKSQPKPGIVVCTAGTTDIPVAEEAAVTAEVMGNEIQRIFDVGVAGLQRILAQKEKLEACNVVIVVAGMDGALPTVVSGLIDRPVIAVPTSVGYGASFRGVAPLLTMLNACSPGVTVVNIDNGFGAGYFAGMINNPS